MDNDQPVPAKRKPRKTSHRKRSMEKQENQEFEKRDHDSEEVEGDDEMHAEQRSRRSSESSTKQKKRSRHKTNGRRQVPETAITAVLEELCDDTVDEPPRRDAGDFSVTEPIPQTSSNQLSDRVYVERKHGFTTAPREKLFQSLNYEEDLQDASYLKSVTSPLELAILVQKFCRPFYTLCHGILGGMALLHIIFVYGAGNYYSEENNFVHMYVNYARIYQTLFHFLSIICFISVMDRYDAKRLDLKHLIDLFQYNISAILVLIVYLVTVVLTLVITKWDDWLALLPYSSTVHNTSDEMYSLEVWKNLNLCRNIGAISGWMLVALFPAEDMFYVHLCSMKKYQTVTTTSARY